MLALAFVVLLLNAFLLALAYGALMSVATDLQAASAAADANMDKVLAAFQAAQAAASAPAPAPDPADQAALAEALTSMHSIAAKIGQVITPA